jgi:prostaglandin reductase 1
VIGCASTTGKLHYLKQLGFDHIFNYKTEDLDSELQAAAPGGIDVFYDNVNTLVYYSYYWYLIFYQPK